ncbi:protein of unknown function [Pararobbsia alpina]
MLTGTRGFTQRPKVPGIPADIGALWAIGARLAKRRQPIIHLLSINRPSGIIPDRTRDMQATANQ